jgi:CheY-like chemotaxis protein
MQELRKHGRIAYQGQVLINNLVKAPCVSLCEAGMFVGTSYHLQLHSVPTLEFMLNRDLIRTKAEVRHSRKDIGAGLQFLGISNPLRDIVKKYVEFRLTADCPLSSRKILHIDPDPLKRRLYKSRLVADGYMIFEAGDGAEALSIISQRKIDLIIMELYLKDMEGLSLISQIRQNAEWLNIPIIVLSFKNILYDVKRARELGANDIMFKMTTSPVLLSGSIKKLLRPAPQTGTKTAN